MIKKTFSILSLLLISILSACGQQANQTQPAAAAQSSQTTAAASNVSFTKDVMPIFESQCVNCHGGEQTKKGLDLKTYEGLMAGSSNGSVIEPGNAGNSSLVQQIVDGKMPRRGSKLTPNEIQIITDWVNSGAIKN